MKEHYYIKEFASMLNISDQTLRYYDKIGLLKPAETNASNNYRMYNLMQIWTLERIRYLQTLGLNLDEIKASMATEDIEDLEEMLQRKQAVTREELRRLEEVNSSIQEYLDYYRHVKTKGLHGHPFVMSYDARYLLTEPYRPGEGIVGTAGPRLLIKKAGDDFAQTSFLRQIGFLLDFQSLRRGELRPTHYFTFIKGKPALDRPDILEIRSGDFLCVRGKILREGDAQLEAAGRLFADNSQDRLALAMECEISLDTSNDAFLEALFEIQVLL